VRVQGNECTISPDMKSVWRWVVMKSWVVMKIGSEVALPCDVPFPTAGWIRHSTIFLERFAKGMG
jgi:hypothetical protein